ncbi:transient receptor potential cation channel subfamily V member 5-like isoform X4 [Haliotis rufescens]|uniref:transient receptor potential cation channel subfamily V member 5-like isoform X4 n=1 Tax=Haliotis rufescens TaxID=6454 RepID=UPI00201EC204|nr:transient receptor potential cation channel subfamily V member 5-like isoform X4 [Haliotis rufescens]
MDRKKKGKSKIVPSEESDSLQGLSNPGFEMSSKGGANNLSTSAKFRELSREVTEKSNALHVISNVKQAASKWSNYIARKRIRKPNNPNDTIEIEHGELPKRKLVKSQRPQGDEDETEKPKTSGIGLDDIHNEYATPGSETIRSVSKGHKEQMMSIASNRALIQYFAKLGQSQEDEMLNLDFVDHLLKSGADINCCDKFGQTILHEVARHWHCDVARFLLEHGANVNQQDKYGRSPLHVAAAVDYPQMANLLIDRGAEKEARTVTEDQTPVHYAAKNDAVNSMKALIKNGCLYKMVKDYKGRTPIHVAAELDRSESARVLLELSAPVGVSDNKGQKAITWMITKMAPVASEALKQFRTTDRPNRKQYYYLNLLVQDRKLDPGGHTQTPLQVMVQYSQFHLVMQESVNRLILVMWNKFGARGAWINLLINFAYICLWSAIGILVEYDQRHKYIWPDQWWRIVLLLTAIGFTVWQVFEEVREFSRSKRAHSNWVKWRTKEIEQDMEFCHPRWPEEKQFLKSELTALDKLNPKYFNDAWNIFDWTCYFFLLLSITTHFADIAIHSNLLARWHIRIMCVTIILLWLRLMKNARAFSTLGPFVVMLGKMIGDLLKFCFLYLEFYIPYACAFWMIFGGDKQKESDGTLVEVDGFGYPTAMMFTLFRLTLVDEYDYANMKLVDSLMADLLVGTWLALSAILCLNLLIALLSDTFQRVYDNAQANAVMQRAITILNIWEGMSKKRRLKFLTFIENECSPQSDYYDDDLTQAGEEDLKKVTIQIKEQLDDLQEQWKTKFGGFETSGMFEESGVTTTNISGSIVTNDRFDHEIHILRDSVNQLKLKQEEIADRSRRDMKAVKILLQQLLRQDGGGDGDGGGFTELEIRDSRMSGEFGGEEAQPGTSVRKMKKRKKAPKGPYQHEDLLVPLEDQAAADPRRIRIGGQRADISTISFPDSETAEHETDLTEC